MRTKIKKSNMLKNFNKEKYTKILKIEIKEFSQEKC